MKNIFIEGIPGMGKSTLLNAIHREKPEYRIFREGDFYIISYTKILTDIPGFHKDLEKFEIYNGRRTLQELETIVFSRYEKFSGNGYLFECSFFQNLIEDLMLFHLLSDEEIVTFFEKLFGRINQEHFLLLYLYSDKVEECIKVIKEERCDNQGNELWYRLMLEYLMHAPLGIRRGYKSLEDMTGHFKNRQKLELRIIKEILGEHGVVLPAKEWEIEEILPLL